MRCFTTAAIGVLILVACDDAERRNAAEPARPDAPPTAPPASTEKAPTSVMRPSVAAEAEPPAPPPPEPAQSTVHFKDGVMSLSDEARAILDDLVQEPVVAAGGMIVIRGHSDSRGHDGDNLVASAKRAQAVLEYLSEKGIPDDRMTAIALGEGRPAAPNVNLDGSDNAEGRAKNRRVEVEVQVPPPAPAAASQARTPATAPPKS